MTRLKSTLTVLLCAWATTGGAASAPVSGGTAFVVGSDGWLLTCAHVVKDATKIEVRLGEMRWEAEVVATSAPNDVALLHVQAHGLPALPLGDSDKVELGEDVRAFGFPLTAELGDGIKVNRGTISGITIKDAHKALQTDVPVNHGNSGGPLVNSRGEVIGIVNAKLTGSSVSNVAFAVAIGYALPLLRDQAVDVRRHATAPPSDAVALVRQVVASVAIVSVHGGAPAAPKPVAAVELPKPDAEGFVSMLSNKDLTASGWVGSVKGYALGDDGVLECLPKLGGNLLTAKIYTDFEFRFEFKLTPGANNGVGIRVPANGGGNPSYTGLELQILDDAHEKYKGWLKDYQCHASIYGCVAAKRGLCKPVGEWNTEEVTVKGRQVKIVVNGQVAIDADLDKVTPLDHGEHPGLKSPSGRVGFLGHTDQLWFRNVRIKDLATP